MNRRPLRDRVVGALALQPMTQAQISSCLCITQQTTSAALRRLSARGVVRPHGWVGGKRGKAMLFEVAA